MNKTSAINFSAVVTGAIIGLFIDIGLTALAMGIGLVSVPWEQGNASGTAAIISGAATMLVIGLVSFGAGAYIAGRGSNFSSRWHGAVHGLASFALAALFLTFVGGSIGLSVAGSLTEKVGMSAGAAAGTSALMSQLSNVKIVTDLSMIQGKAVTQIVPPGNGQGMGGAMGNTMNQAQSAAADPSVQAQAKEVAADARQGVAIAGFGLAALMLIVGAFSAWTGATGAMSAARFATSMPELPAQRAA